VQRLRALASGDYALGWQAGVLVGRPVLVHDGAEYGFVAYSLVEVSGDASVFAMTNTSDVTSRGDASWVIDVLGGLMLALEHEAQPGH